MPAIISRSRFLAAPEAPEPRFPGDPGVGNYYVGVAGGPVQQVLVNGTNASDLNAFADWSQRPASIYHDYSTEDNGRVDIGKLDAAINADCIPAQSFKMNRAPDSWTLAEIVAGAADADLLLSTNACKARAPWPIWLCYYHEPEENFPTTTEAADYRAAYRYIVQFFRDENVTNVAWCPIYMCPWTFSSGSGRDWRRWHADWKGTTTNTSADWWTGADRMMDLFGIDVYNANINSTTFEDFSSDIIGTMMTDLNANAFVSTYGEPIFAIFEFGMSSDTSPWPGSAWSTYGAEVRDWAQDTGAGIVYWNHNQDQTPSRYFFTAAADPDGQKLAGWRVITAAATDFDPPS